jgi:hypothetical protein
MHSEFSISTKAENLFLLLAESIAQTLNVTLCSVCGGTNMGEHQPWEARELGPWEPFNETDFLKHKKGVWLLKTSIIGNYCISHSKGQFFTLVGDLTFLGQKFSMTLPNSLNGGELQTTQNPSSTHWSTSLIS